jgi:hypothetical protein
LLTAVAIALARGWSMSSRALSAASDKAGSVRAIRPSCTIHSSSAIEDTASITSSDGSSRNNLASIGRASILPLKLDGFRGSQRVGGEWATRAVAPKRPAIKSPEALRFKVLSSDVRCRGPIGGSGAPFLVATQVACCRSATKTLDPRSLEDLLRDDAYLPPRRSADVAPEKFAAST